MLFALAHRQAFVLHPAHPIHQSDDTITTLDCLADMVIGNDDYNIGSPFPFFCWCFCIRIK